LISIPEIDEVNCIRTDLQKQMTMGSFPETLTFQGGGGESEANVNQIQT